MGDQYEKMGPRLAAARALAATGEPTAKILLALKLRLPEGELPEVLSECMDALMTFAPDPALAELLAPYVKHSDPYLVATAATNLASLRKEGAIEPLLEALPVAPEEARVALVYALASIRGEGAQAALRELTEHPDQLVRATAKECLNGF